MDTAYPNASQQTIFQAAPSLLNCWDLRGGERMTHDSARQERLLTSAEAVSAVNTPSMHRSMDTHERIVEFMRRASTEITTHDAKLVPDLAEALLPGTTVYVAHTPKASLDEVVAVSIELQSRGLRASPHIVARQLASKFSLRQALGRMRSAGIDQALVIAGDREVPVGPFSSSLDVIRSGTLQDAQLRKIAFAGHPEGHHAMDAGQLLDSLRQKQDFARQTGIEVNLTTQFSFDAAAVCQWVRKLRVHDIQLPVHVGIAGPTSPQKLLRFALKCGVGASLQSVLRNPGSVSSLAGMGATPEEMIGELVRLGAGEEASQIIKPHLFTFGGALAGATWIRAVASGKFDLMHNGSLQLTTR
jgi:methylenetetrahydrofolate reductase (NADH)